MVFTLSNSLIVFYQASENFFQRISFGRNLKFSSYLDKKPVISSNILLYLFFLDSSYGCIGKEAPDTSPETA